MQDVPRPTVTSGVPASAGQGAAVPAGIGSGEASRDDLAPEDPYIHKMEIVVSWVLRIGVVLSVAIVVAGLGLMFAHHPGYLRLTRGVPYRRLTQPSTPFPHTFGQLATALRAGEGRGVIVLGLIVLLATPILRVAVGIIGFALERDLKMTLACVFVFCVLIFSLVIVAH
jgi:uncharacterized membrane protein